MKKKVAVIVRDRQQEALRMSVGLTLADNQVTVFIMDRKLEAGEEIDIAVETLGAMNAKLISNNPENNFDRMTTEEIARALTGFDTVIPY